MLKIIVVCVVIACIQAQHARNGTESNEHGVMKFFYDKTSHAMMLHVNSDCYVWFLDDTHRHDVHDADGIREMEVKLVAMSADATKQSAMPDDDINHAIRKHCGHHATIVKVAE